MKTLNLNNKQSYELLPLEPDFVFEDVANEICIGDSDPVKSYDPLYLDGTNDSKLMITFQYSDLEKNFIDEDIFYSEEIEVKEEEERISESEAVDNEGIHYDKSTFDASHIPSNFMEVQNEVVIEKDGASLDVDNYGEVIQNLVQCPPTIGNTLPNENKYHKKIRIKPESEVEGNSNIPVVPTDSNDRPKSIFGESMGVSKCSICFKFTKRSCYEAHMKQHYEQDMTKTCYEKKGPHYFYNENSSTKNGFYISSNNEFETSFIDNLTLAHEEVVDQNDEEVGLDSREQAVAEDQKFHCKHCEFFTFTESDLEHHMKLHECQKLNKCPFCSYESAQSITMKAHIKSHESNNSYECNKCTYRTTERAHFTRHMRRHTGDKPFKCNLCGYSAVQGSALKSHLRRHYGDKPHKCPFCEYRSVERTSLVRHIRIHTGEKPHACPYCDYKSIQKSSLKAHLKKHYGEHHECDKCEFKTIQKTCLSRHLKRHNPEKPHKCKLCDYQSIQKASLRTHMRRHLGEKPYQCSHCDYSCVEKTHLNRHLLQHTGEKPIFCFVCDYRCIQFSSLVSHYKRHEGVLINCAFCEFKTVRTEIILNHLKTEHKGSWNSQSVSCPLCEFKCNTKEALDSHMRNHIESFAEDAANAVSEKVYKCADCDFKSISKKLLKSHKKQHKRKRSS